MAESAKTPFKESEDKKAKGFSSSGIPEKEFFEFQKPGATFPTPAENGTNTQKEDKG